MANKKHLSPHDYLSVSIPIELIEKFRTHCHDPLTGKPKHGQQSKIIQALLAGFLAKQGIKIEAPKGLAIDTFEVSLIRSELLTPANTKQILEDVIAHGWVSAQFAIQPDDERSVVFNQGLAKVRYQMPETL